MEIIKSLPIKKFMPASNFSCKTILLFYKKKPFQIFGEFRGLLKETNSKNWRYCVEKNMNG